jgi:bifunctional UDP-N-acetylglucosamine pyrophosphorylase/glucosamine-1-phosphate N-acetyltransferase
MNKTAAVILAAGRGTRMNSHETNKVMSMVHDKPLLQYSINNLHKAHFSPIVVVVGFAKESIMNYFGSTVLYAEQMEAKGTAHALSCGLSILSSDVGQILSVYGDDSYLYSPELLVKLINTHEESKAEMTVLTVEMDDPTGLGRIVRDEKGYISGIVEEKNATNKERNIQEINTGCYVFKRAFLEEFLPKITENPVAHEYYLTDIIELAVRHNKKIEAVQVEKIPWRGVNGPEELEEARKLLDNTN